MNKKYIFRDSVRVYDNGENEIRLRTGIFNYEEVTLDMSTISEDLADYMREIIEKLQMEEGYELTRLEDTRFEQYEKEIVHSIINELCETNYVIEAGKWNLEKEISLSLLGFMNQEGAKEYSDSNETVLLFYSDDQYMLDAAKKMVKDMDINMDFLSEEKMQKVRQSDLTSNLDGLSTVQDINYFGETFKKYRAIVMCLKNLSVTAMRNMNRISVNFEIPVIFTFIDGPIIGALAINPYTTGCLECFELRTLARLEDHVQYHNFVKKERDYMKQGSHNNVGMIPLLNMIVNLAISEAYTLQHIGASKLTGRLLTIYIPTLEIQAQDILRIPYCSACGAVAKINLEEKNVSSRAFVDEMVENVLMV